MRSEIAATISCLHNKKSHYAPAAPYCSTTRRPSQLLTSQLFKKWAASHLTISLPEYSLLFTFLIKKTVIIYIGLDFYDSKQIFNIQS